MGVRPAVPCPPESVTGCDAVSWLAARGAERAAYGRACLVEELNGIIEVGPAHALVLGDDPAATTFLPERSLLARRIAGDHDVDYCGAVAELLPLVVWDSRVEWTIQGATV
ncbi:Imm21 family immunity protein [Streptomyces sp. 6-11-2]|uniref:Imm21 family immunity protein n=1 Tax=Streptomyces sp. 6-11-2 TaxID=2585753 RepID=UPI001141C014|nr:Imm21 family immunity protein [Streptomyces sp. 6-11-2]